MSVAQPATPFVRVDLDRLRRNIERMQAQAGRLGASLRPHFKTHRSPLLAGLQLDAGAHGLTCATLGQLQAALPITPHVLISGQPQLDPTTHAVLAANHEPTTIYAASSEAAVRALRHALGPDVPAQLLLEIDVGCDRGGLNPDECPRLARAAADLGLAAVGVFAYPGQGYAPRQQAAAAEREHRLLEESAAHLTNGGFEVEHISAGSSPTMAHAHAGSVTEYRPGSYVFGDAQQVELGTLTADQVAISVVSTVIAARDGQVVLDAGGKALGRDSPPWLVGHGRLSDDWTVTIDRLYDHHAIITQNGGEPAFDVGDRVAVAPNNANSALALRRHVWIEDAGQMRRETIASDDWPEAD